MTQLRFNSVSATVGLLLVLTGCATTDGIDRQKALLEACAAYEIAALEASLTDLTPEQAAKLTTINAGVALRCDPDGPYADLVTSPAYVAAMTGRVIAIASK